MSDQTQTKELNIEQLLGARNVVNGMLQVLNSGYCPGYLSAELHNGRLYCENLIKDMDVQVAELKKLAQEQHKVKLKSKKRAEKEKQRYAIRSAKRLAEKEAAKEADND